MKLSQFKFKLPDELIAQYPAYNRDEARMLVLHRKTGEIEHRVFKEILDYFDEKDIFLFNDTKVFPARLYGNKEKTGAQIEVFLLRELNREMRYWDVLVEPARKIRIGNKLYFGNDDSIVAEVIDNTTSRGRTLRFLFDSDYESFRKSLFEQLGIRNFQYPLIAYSQEGHGASPGISLVKAQPPTFHHGKAILFQTEAVLPASLQKPLFLIVHSYVCMDCATSTGFLLAGFGGVCRKPEAPDSALPNTVQKGTIVFRLPGPAAVRKTELSDCPVQLGLLRAEQQQIMLPSQPVYPPQLSLPRAGESDLYCSVEQIGRHQGFHGISLSRIQFHSA